MYAVIWLQYIKSHAFLPPPPGPPHGSVPAMFPGDPAYGLYLYQSWAQAAAKLGPGGAGPMHPAAAAAWQAHLAQAVKVTISSVPRNVTCG